MSWVKRILNPQSQEIRPNKKYPGLGLVIGALAALGIYWGLKSIGIF
jgi:hypothetical protein